MTIPVKFELAKLLRKKGFDDVKSNSVFYTCNFESNFAYPYHISKSQYLSCREQFKPYYLAPTIAEVVCWIYSKYQIWIQVSILKDDEWHYSIRRKDNNWNIEFPTKEKYTSMENAYEKGINVVLNTYKPKS